MLIFTITGGRTGTAWLAELLARNLKIPAYHEHTGVDDFGTKTPDIRTLRNFNHFGFNEVVRKFWYRKLSALPKKGYAESSHVNAKAGLIEGLAHHNKEATIICLQREDIAAQALSYAIRGDFRNITMLWQWYLDPFYPRIIMSPDLKTGNPMLDRIGWYIFEITARQSYYKKHYPQFNYIDTTLEEMTSNPGALLRELGHKGAFEVPEPMNGNPFQPSEAAKEMVQQAFGGWTAEKVRKQVDEKIPAFGVWEQPREEGRGKGATGLDRGSGHDGHEPRLRGGHRSRPGQPPAPV